MHTLLPCADLALPLPPTTPPGLTEEADEGGEAPGPRLVYRPVELGRAAALLPEYFQEEIKFEEAQVGLGDHAFCCGMGGLVWQFSWLG